ncbi:MAG: hypothetical protein C5B54_10040 [Acidobacteria bacterium]|nr:MAG: hypothetical protein C5B54_10040 [Acidobacteriota bacterium]
MYVFADWISGRKDNRKSIRPARPAAGDGKSIAGCSPGLVLRNSKNWLRLIGIALLIFLLSRINLQEMLSALRQAALPLVLLAVIANVPQIFLKAIRWRQLLRSQGIEYAAIPAMLSYFGSIFIGLLTPGRLGELVKAAHVSHDCNIPKARAFSSVLVDRLFDLYALMILGGAALLSQHTGMDKKNAIAFALSAAVLVIPLIVFLKFPIFSENSWIGQMRISLLELKLPAILIGSLLTIIAYAIFFEQCYLLAQSLMLNATFLQISYAVALGSLVTLIPISISGLGTREAAIMSYLKTIGISPAASIGFSLLIFLTFYVAGGLMGAIAWYIKPVEWKDKK